MAEGVIDPFEIIDIEHGNRKGNRVAQVVLDFAFQFVFHFASVVGAGHDIGNSACAQFLLQLVAVADGDPGANDDRAIWRQICHVFCCQNRAEHPVSMSGV